MVLKDSINAFPNSKLAFNSSSSGFQVEEEGPAIVSKPASFRLFLMNVFANGLNTVALLFDGIPIAKGGAIHEESTGNVIIISINGSFKVITISFDDRLNIH